MKKIVISLGGSVIIPNSVNYDFLENFKKTVRKYYGKYKFIVVCGGGSIARAYINALKQENKPRKILAEAGIRATRLNAMFLIQFFGKEANEKLPLNMRQVEDKIRKNNIVICGALRYSPNSTSDSTAAKLAQHLKSEFINITNVSGLYTSDPAKNKEAKLISNISWIDFERKAKKMKYMPGQHFVLDQQASVIIRKNKIKTYLIGPDMKNFDRLLSGQKFEGTTIEG